MIYYRAEQSKNLDRMIYYRIKR